MPKTRPRGRSRGRATTRPRPRQSWVRRNVVWLGIAAAGLVVILAVGSRGDDGDKSATAGADGGFIGGDLHSLVVDPSTPGRLFLGGHAAVSTSTDGGRTWSRVKSLDDADAMGWTFTSEAIWVSGHPGINRSADGARSFRRANDGLPDTDVHAFGAAGATLYGASPSAGVFASTDGGKTWTVRAAQAGQSFFGRILVDAADDQHLVAADVRDGAAESNDGGRTWRRLGGPPSAAWVSRSGDTLYVSDGAGGAARRRDAGRNWERVDLPPGATLLEAGPTNPDLFYAAGIDGQVARVWMSRDGGRHWARP